MGKNEAWRVRIVRCLIINSEAFLLLFHEALVTTASVHTAVESSPNSRNKETNHNNR